MRSTGEPGRNDRTIVFTDSRDDAATTAIGLASNHYSDLVRQLVGQVLELAGIQTGRRNYRPLPVAVDELVDGALADCREML